MNTLTEKDLKYYLGTGLQFLTCYNIEDESVIEEMTLNYLQSFIEFPVNEKPLFLPLSALTEQLPDGSIPIVELAKIHDKNLSDENYCTISKEKDSDGSYFMVHYLSDIHKDISCHFVVTDECEFQANALFHNSNPSKYETVPVHNQLQLFEYLYANHFWLGDQSLFETGEIIDKRTVTIP